MAKVPWNKLSVWFVSGVGPDEVAKIISPHTDIDGEKKSRVHQADNGVLVQVRDTDPDAANVVGCLIARFGQDRVVDASKGRPARLG